MAETKPPKVFISYAWEDDLKTWVLDFATRLRLDGTNAILDQWETVPGDQLPEFMEKSVRESDFVVFVCTPTYKRKSDRRRGGVGYEGSIITGEVFQKNNHRKFIPVLRKGKWASAAPSWATSKLFIDFRDIPYSEASYQQLLNTLFGKSPTAPPILDDTLREIAKREAVEKIAREKAEREAAEKAEREKVEQEATEKVARQKAERESAEKAERERIAKEMLEKAEHEAAEKAAREKAKREAAEKAGRERLEREAAEKTEDISQNQTVVKIQPEILKRLPSQGYKPDKDNSVAQKPKTEKPKPSSIKIRRKPNMATVVALIGLAGIIIAALLSSPLIANRFSPPPVSSRISSVTFTVAVKSITPSRTTEPSPAPTKTFLLTPSKTKEPTSTHTPYPTMYIQSLSGTSGESPLIVTLKIANVPIECTQQACDVLWEVYAYTPARAEYSSGWVDLDTRRTFTYTFTDNPTQYIFTINDYTVAAAIRLSSDEMTIYEVAVRINVH